MLTPISGLDPSDQLRPDDLFPVTDVSDTGLSATGRTKRVPLGQLTNRLPAKWFGMKADGSTDDAAAFQLGIDHLEAEGGGTLELPPGIPLLGSPVGFKPKVNVIAPGRFVTTIKSGFTDANAALLYNAAKIDKQITLGGFGIDATGAGFGLRLGKADASAVFAHSNLDDIYIIGASQAGLHEVHSVSNNFFGLEVKSCTGYGLWVQPHVGAATNDSHYFGARFSENELGGVYIDGTLREPVAHIFVGATVEANGTLANPAAGIKAYKAAALRVENSWFESLSTEQQYGVHIVDRPTALVDQQQNSATILGNTFRLIGESAVRLENVENALLGWNSSGSFTADGAGANIYVDANCNKIQLLWNTGRFDGTTDRHIVNLGTNVVVTRPSGGLWAIPQGFTFEPKTTNVGTDYTIDLRAVMREEITNKDAFLVRGRDIILEDSTTDPLTVNVKILDNVRGASATPQSGKVFLKVRLTAYLRHAQAGGFDTLEQEYHFFHQIASTSGVDHGGTAAFASALTGQTNESLAMSISNVTQSGASQSADQDDHWIAFDLTVSSGRTTPKLTLTAEIEAFANVA